MTDRFLPLRELADAGTFGKKLATLRRIAQLQNVDRAHYRAKCRISWSTVDSYPTFVFVGGRWGLYQSQVDAYVGQKIGEVA